MLRTVRVCVCVVCTQTEKLIASISADQNLTNINASNGNGLSSASTDKDSLTPSPTNRLSDDVKAEPMELVCGNHNLPSDDQSNDSVGDNDGKYLVGVDGKGSLRYTLKSV